MMPSSPHEAWASLLGMNDSPLLLGEGLGVMLAGGARQNQDAVHLDGIRGALWLPKGAGVLPASYLRRDATALGLLLLSMLDITSSFL